MFKKLFAFILVVPLVFAGCASQQTDWTPAIDPYGDENAANIDPDTAECGQLAERAAGDAKGKAIAGAIGAGLLGAAAGAALGAAGGSPGTGAKIGAAIGGIGGATTVAGVYDEQYKKSFIECMKNRGHNVIN